MEVLFSGLREVLFFFPGLDLSVSNCAEFREIGQRTVSEGEGSSQSGSGAQLTSSEVSSPGQQLLRALEHLDHGFSVAAASKRGIHILPGGVCMGHRTAPSHC